MKRKSRKEGYPTPTSVSSAPGGGGAKSGASSNGKNGRSKTTRKAKSGGKKLRRRGPRKRISAGIEEVLDAVKPRDLKELFRFWSDNGSSEAVDADAMRDRVRVWMSEPTRIEERVLGLGRRLGAVVESLIRAPSYQRTWEELAASRMLSKLNDYDLEACISALGRRGFVVEGRDNRFEKLDERVIALPVEVGDGLVLRRREKVCGIFGVVTLRGHLDQLYADKNRRMTPQRLREMYKMYSQESAAVARIERLPEGVRGLVEKAILEFGGILPRQLFERTETDLPHWNARRWRMILEQSLVGTVQELDLSRYGINLQDETLVVFNEVALAWLKRVAVPGDPDRPHEELSLGIDLASNITRFLNYIDENDVRYTVRGEIFKTTEKKILQHLIPNPGREISREDVLSFIFHFARHAELIDRTGKRTFSVTPAGRSWSGLELGDKQQQLFDFALEDQKLPGEAFHQLRMRRIFVRLIKRVEPGTWYDLMYLPFLARNTYVSTLDDLQVEEHFADRSQTGRIPAMEDPQRLAWNLVKWVRERLYLLGCVDLGYDKVGRPVALRVTPEGARRMGIDAPPGSDSSLAANGVGSLVVTPDFEVVLFPTGDDAELIHALDRFCSRERKGSIVHLRITEEGVQRALRDGMALDDLLGLLETHSRTPVPQNVCFSIRDWARLAGRMCLGQDMTLSCEDAEVLRRLASDPGARQYVETVINDTTVQLEQRFTQRRMRSLLRDLGFIVDVVGGEG